MPFKSIFISASARNIHSITALVSVLFILILTISGLLLAFSPISESIKSMFAYPGSESDISIAQLAENSLANYPNVEQIERTATGEIVVYYTTDDRNLAAQIIDPLTGNTIASYDNSQSILDKVKYFHRSLMLDDFGRVVVGVVSVLLLLILFTGLPLLAKCLGGWGNVFKRIRGSPESRLHGYLSRIVLLPLFLSSLSGAYLSLVRFGYLPGDEALEPDFPSVVTLGEHAPVQSLFILQGLNVSQLRNLTFPYTDDPEGIFSLNTDKGMGYVDPVTGQWLDFLPHTNANKVYEFAYALHTGEGLWWVMIFVALGALFTPVMVYTGIKIWWRRRQLQKSQRLKHNVRAVIADTVILVGSEGHSSWPFAKILHCALTAVGLKVHCNEMNHIAHYYPKAKCVLILTSTYGDGCPPSSAEQFGQRLIHIKDNANYNFAVLGFGDRQYPNFCGFAIKVEKLLIKKGWKPLLPIELIDRQSPQAFARWGKLLSAKLNKNFELNYIPERPETTLLTLVKRHVYDAGNKLRIVILRFRAEKGAKLPKFSVGDLLGVFPPTGPCADAKVKDRDTADIPRLYSIGSCENEGFIEIGVSLHEKGLCSNALFALQINSTIEAFVKRNEDFHHRGSGNPLILIGAGTGIVPLMGFIRNNHACHPIYLYWGGRDPALDYLYKEDLAQMLSNRHLTALRVAFSRVEPKAYVQDIIREDREKLRQLLMHKGELMICGGREMAEGVREALEEILLTTNITLAEMKNAHRYREDVY